MIKTIKYAKLHSDAIPPFRKNLTDSGVDFCSIEDILIKPHSITIVKTGISLEIPEGYMLLIKPKGKNNHLIGAGVVDAFYHPGEILIKVANISSLPLPIKKGNAIGQGVFIPIETPELIEVEQSELINNSERSYTGWIVDQAKVFKKLEGF